MIIPNRAQDMRADSGQLSVQIHGSDPWIRSMDPIQKSRKTSELEHYFVTKSVRFGRTELSLRLRKALGEI